MSPKLSIHFTTDANPRCLDGAYTKGGAPRAIFINTSRRPDLKEIIEKLKAETGIVFNADLV